MGACRVSQQPVGLGLGAALPGPAPGLSLPMPGARGSFDGPGSPWPTAYAVAVLRGSSGVFYTPLISTNPQGLRLEVKHRLAVPMLPEGRAPSQLLGGEAFPEVGASPRCAIWGPPMVSGSHWSHLGSRCAPHLGLREGPALPTPV